MAASIVPSPQQVQTIPLKEEAQITQVQLTRVIGLRNSIALLKARLEGAEEEVRAALESGANVEPGVHVASLQESFRRSVCWRAVAEKLAIRLFGNGRGAVYCENVLQHTAPSRSVNLIVS